MMPQKSENDDIMLSALIVVVLDRNFFCLYVGVDESIKSFNHLAKCL